MVNQCLLSSAITFPQRQKLAGWGKVYPTNAISLKSATVGLMSKLERAKKVVAFLAKERPCHETVG